MKDALFQSANCAPGDMVYMNVLGNSTLFVNSYEIATDLLDKKSAITSSRTYTTMLCELWVAYPLLKISVLIHF